MKQTHVKYRGFTLIEILVVIGIIALLGAILFPVLSRARESARAKSCISNMQQLGLAFQQYTQDFGRRYPGAGQFQRWENGGHWVTGTNSSEEGLASSTYEYTLSTAQPSADVEGGALYRYARSESIYHCPSAKDGDVKKVTYSMNCAIAGINDVRLRTPSEIVLLVDEDHNNDGFFYTHGGGSTDALTDIHNGAGNLLFADGHVKSYTRAAYPLVSSKDDGDPEISAAQRDKAKKLKQQMTGTPRFYDKAFGTDPAHSGVGYYVSPAFGSCAGPG